jgi:hypothetical protein
MKKWLLAAVAGVAALSMLYVPSSVAAPGKLGGTLSVQVKSLTVDRTEEGSRIIAAIRLTNDSRETVRVPEYEVRAVTTDNLSYTLQPGADNPVSIYPLETAELHYMLLVKRSGSFEVTQLDWIQMNKNVYPRTETKVLSLAVTQNKTESRVWGQSFVLPSGPSHITITPVKLHKQTFLDSLGVLIAFRADNRGSEPGYVSDFLVEGQTNKKKYDAVKMSGETKTALEPGESSLIYYRLLTNIGEELKSLKITTQESFRDAGQNPVAYRPGGITVFIPNHLNKTLTLDQLPEYKHGEVIPLDPGNRLIPKEVEISLSKLATRPWTTSGLKPIVAEFTIVNRSPVPLPKPEFAVELMSQEGRKYLGTLMPKEEPLFKYETEPDMDKTGAINPYVPYTISFEFHLPVGEIGRQMGVVLSDNISHPPFRIPMASIQTTVQ